MALKYLFSAFLEVFSLRVKPLGWITELNAVAI